MIKAFVHFIESPRPDDILDGRTEGRALVESLQLASITVEYNLAVTGSAFRSCLDQRLVVAWKKHVDQLLKPIIHLSCHGNRDGISLTDGEFIAWPDLRPLLLPALNAMNGGLLLCMSSCGGAYAGTMAMDEDSNKPFWNLVGPQDSVSWPDAAVGFASFYHLFFKEVPISDCVKGMNTASGTGAFSVFSGQYLRDGWMEALSRANSPQPETRTLADMAGSVPGPSGRTVPTVGTIDPAD